MKKTFYCVIMSLCICSAPFFASADFIKESGGGLINWSKGIISVETTASFKTDSQGIAVTYSSENAESINRLRMRAYETARQDAALAIARAIQAIRIDPDTTVADIIKTHPYMQSRIADQMSRAIITKEYPGDFFSVKCNAVFNMGAIISSLPYSYPNEPFPTRDFNPISTPYTSLIIDTRGMKIEPMLFPAIYDEDGLQVFNRYMIDIRFACKYGMVSYCYNEDEANRHKKAGEHPYYTIALKNMQGCPVLSHRDIRKIFSSEKTAVNLKKCRVIFILDRKETAAHESAD